MAQIVHNVVVDSTVITTGKENDDWGSVPMGILTSDGTERRQDIYLSVLQCCCMIACAC